MTPVELPVERPSGCPFDPPAELGRLRERSPIVRLRLAGDRLGWLVTGHALAREVLADRRFSSRYELMRYPVTGAPADTMPPALVGDLTGIDPPEHTRYRKPLVGKFTVRRMNLLTERAEQIVAEHLDAMESHGGPADLVRTFAHPVPTLMICELLGVPYTDRATFMRHTAALSDPEAGPEEQYAAYGALQDYVGELVRAQRAHPGDNLLGDLTGTDLTDEELAGVGAFLLGAGIDTTANMLGLGAFALLQNPVQLAALHKDPERAVEELLRYLSIAHTGMRAALEDVELGGQLVKAGETVVVSVQAANRDPGKYPDPDTLDLSRAAAGHLSFGHGLHQCLGQQLARVEMRIAFPALFARFPSLRLAIPAEQVPPRSTMAIDGVLALPVTWDA